MMNGRRGFLSVYGDARVLTILFLGFSSGLPYLLTFSTLSAWLTESGVDRAAVGAFLLVRIPYNFKFLWAPLLDRIPPPLPLGRRRGWGVFIQLLLLSAILVLGFCHPRANPLLTAAVAVIVAFLSASQDVVIDAYRVESLETAQQGPGAGLYMAGYRVAMLVSGAGALFLAEAFGWTVAYGAMALLLLIGLLVFLIRPEPDRPLPADTLERERRVARRLDDISALHGQKARILSWLYDAMIDPFADFMKRPDWLLILVFVASYKLGEAMAGGMAIPLYLQAGFSLHEIAWISKLFGALATVAGSLAGGVLVNRLGPLKALMLGGVLQSLGNLFYVLQAEAGHQLSALALCVGGENLTGGIAAAALVAYLSGLCNVAFTATQYALLSSLATVGITLFASAGGWLSLRLGWVDYFLLTSLATLPSLLLLAWMMRRGQIAARAPVSG